MSECILFYSIHTYIRLSGGTTSAVGPKKKKKVRSIERGTRSWGRLWGRSPQNLRWGNGPSIRPSNISRSTVIGCESKYELSKKRCEEVFCSEIKVSGHMRLPTCLMYSTGCPSS